MDARFTPRFGIMVGIAFELLGIASSFAADEPKKTEWLLKVISSKTLSNMSGADGKWVDGLDLRARVSIVEDEGDGRLVAKMTDVKGGSSRVQNYALYVELRKGDLIPFFDYIYRVKDLKKGSGGEFEFGHEVVLEWVPDDKLPEGLTLGSFPRVVWLNWKLYLNDHMIRIERIDPAPDKKDVRRPGKPSAELVINDPTPAKARTSILVNRTATVRAGDILLIGDNGYKVRNVVPKDDKTKAIGWVEFECEDISKEKLDRDKVSYIVPEVKKPK